MEKQNKEPTQEDILKQNDEIMQKLESTRRRMNFIFQAYFTQFQPGGDACGPHIGREGLMKNLNHIVLEIEDWSRYLEEGVSALKKLRSQQDQSDSAQASGSTSPRQLPELQLQPAKEPQQPSQTALGCASPRQTSEQKLSQTASDSISPSQLPEQQLQLAKEPQQQSQSSQQLSSQTGTELQQSKVHPKKNKDLCIPS